MLYGETLLSYCTLSLVNSVFTVLRYYLPCFNPRQIPIAFPCHPQMGRMLTEDACVLQWTWRLPSCSYTSLESLKSIVIFLLRPHFMNHG
jgi:hypothetical protein